MHSTSNQFINRSHQDLGFKHYKKREYKDALFWFLKISANERKKPILLHISYCYEKLGMFQEALDTLKSMHDYHHPQTQMRVPELEARSLVQHKAYDLAIPAFLAIPGWNKTKIINLARSYEETGDFQSAIDTWKREEGYQSNINAIEHITNLYIKLKQDLKVIETCSFTPVNKLKPHIQNVLAIAYCNVNDVDKALPLLLNMPKNDMSCYYLGHCYQLKQEYTQAISFFKRVDPRDSHHRNAVYSIGKCYVELKQYDAAIKQFELLSDEQALIDKGLCYESLGQYDNALEVFYSLPDSLDEDNKQQLIARCYGKKKDFRREIAELERIPGFQKDLTILLHIAINREILGEYEHAIEGLQSILSLGRSNQVLLVLARCYFALDNFVQSIAILETCENYHQDPVILLVIARANESLGKHKTAIELHERIMKLSPHDPVAIIAFARCYQSTKQHSNAINLVKTIPNYASKEETCLFLGICYMDMQKYEQAMEYLDSTCLSGNKSAVLARAGCYRNMGQYEKALQLLFDNSNVIQGFKYINEIGRCYEAMGEYDRAIECYQSLHTEIDKQILKKDLILSACYKRMGLFATAFKTIQDIPNFSKSRDAIIALSGINRAMGKYADALSLLTLVSNYEEDEKVLLSIAHCYEEMGQLDEAIAVFEAIVNRFENRVAQESLFICYRKHKQMAGYDLMMSKLSQSDSATQHLLGMSLYYGAMGKYDRAITACKKIKDWQYDRKALLQLQHIYHMTHNYRLLSETKAEIMRQFPNDIEISEQCCMSQDSLDFVNEQLLKWPYSTKLYLFKAKLEQEQGQREIALNTLQATIKKFPYCDDAYLAIIQHHLFYGDIEAACQHQVLCNQQFEYHHVLSEKITRLMQAKDIIPIWGMDYSLVQETIQVNLPAVVQSVFQSVSSVLKEPCLLVGSMVSTLYTHQKSKLELVIDPSQDLDFVIAQDPSSDITKAGFTKSQYVPRLYVSSREGYSIDLYAAPISNDVGFIQHNALSRDFTVACLFCDATGTIFDPTGTGIQDLDNKVLRTVLEPATCFTDDPTRILRAMKYLAKGYRPTDDLDLAMKAWTCDVDFEEHRSHFMAILKKQLKSVHKESILRSLQHYGLLEKIFGMVNSSALTDQTALTELMQLLNPNKSNGKRVWNQETIDLYPQNYYPQGYAPPIPCIDDTYRGDSITGAYPYDTSIYFSCQNDFSGENKKSRTSRFAPVAQSNVEQYSTSSNMASIDNASRRTSRFAPVATTAGFHANSFYTPHPGRNGSESNSKMPTSGYITLER